VPDHASATELEVRFGITADVLARAMRFGFPKRVSTRVRRELAPQSLHGFAGFAGDSKGPDFRDSVEPLYSIAQVQAWIADLRALASDIEA